MVTPGVTPGLEKDQAAAGFPGLPAILMKCDVFYRSVTAVTLFRPGFLYNLR
jgi:hypothetical protein